MSGQILGDRYEVERQLGKKSGRWTLLARDLLTESPVVLKVLFLDENLEPDDLKLFKREVETLQALSHPSTPRYLGYFEIGLPRDGRALALIQSYLPGKSLSQYMQEQRILSPVEAKRIAASVLEILHYLHNHQPPIVHRDIKPSNLLLSNDAEAIAAHVCLVDFGSVKSLTSSDATTFSIVGTEGYMPPEQVGRRAIIASDLYSLGMTLVAGMAGKEPQDLPRQGFRLDIDQILTLEPLFSAWLKKMIEPDVIKRYRFASDALDGLAQTS